MIRVNVTGNKVSIEYQKGIATLCTLVGEIEGSKMQIESLVTWKEQNRGQGYGKACVEAALRTARNRGCKDVWLASSPQATGFYEKLGFTRDSDSSVMRMHLATQETAWTYANPRVKIKTPDAYALKPHLKNVVPALSAMVDWLERPNRDAGQALKLKTIKTLVDVFGYDAFDGEVYRGLRIKPNPRLKVGTKLRMTVGQYKLTSWSINQRGAAEFGKRLKKAGHATVVVRLVSDELQVASIVWVQAIVNYLMTLTTDLGKFQKEVERISRYLERYFDNDEEVVMYIKDTARVEVVEVLVNPIKSVAVTGTDLVSLVHVYGGGHPQMFPTKAHAEAMAAVVKKADDPAGFFKRVRKVSTLGMTALAYERKLLSLLEES